MEVKTAVILHTSWTANGKLDRFVSLDIFAADCQVQCVIHRIHVAAVKSKTLRERNRTGRSVFLCDRYDAFALCDAFDQTKNIGCFRSIDVLPGGALLCVSEVLGLVIVDSASGFLHDLFNGPGMLLVGDRRVVLDLVFSFAGNLVSEIGFLPVRSGPRLGGGNVLLRVIHFPVMEAVLPSGNREGQFFVFRSDNIFNPL